MPVKPQYDPPINPPIERDRGSIVDATPFWTFDAVQERLIEAYATLRRVPDRENPWLRHKTMGIWDQVSITAHMTAVEQAEYKLYRADDPPRMPGLTRDEIARMDEALGWLAWIADEPRKVVHLAIAQLYSGRASRIQWGSLVSDPRLPGSAERLRKAYGRAITLICTRLNAAFEPA